MGIFSFALHLNASNETQNMEHIPTFVGPIFVNIIMLIKLNFDIKLNTQSFMPFPDSNST